MPVIPNMIPVIRKHIEKIQFPSFVSYSGFFSLFSIKKLKERSSIIIKPTRKYNPQYHSFLNFHGGFRNRRRANDDTVNQP